jgi:hypothetical protein
VSRCVKRTLVCNKLLDERYICRWYAAIKPLLAMHVSPCGWLHLHPCGWYDSKQVTAANRCGKQVQQCEQLSWANRGSVERVIRCLHQHQATHCTSTGLHLHACRVQLAMHACWPKHLVLLSTAQDMAIKAASISGRWHAHADILAALLTIPCGVGINLRRSGRHTTHCRMPTWDV